MSFLLSANKQLLTILFLYQIRLWPVSCKYGVNQIIKKYGYENNNRNI